jgi:hypothetical protein
MSVPRAAPGDPRARRFCHSTAPSSHRKLPASCIPAPSSLGLTCCAAQFRPPRGHRPPASSTPFRPTSASPESGGARR